jgi:hypothetical protein
MLKEKLLKLFEEDEELFNRTIEELDSYNGFLGDDRYYEMELLNEFYNDVEPLELLQRVYFGRDDDTYTIESSGNKTYGEFNPNRNYFYYNGYGNLISSDYKDYSYKLDDYFIDALIENYQYLYLDDEVIEIIEEGEDDEIL